jgi:hypothetical protein
VRLRGERGNLLKTADYRPRRAGSERHGFVRGGRYELGDMRNPDEIEVLRERKFVSASSRNQQAGSASLRSPRQSTRGYPSSFFEVTAVSLRPIPETEDRCGFDPTPDRVAAAPE